MGKRHPDHPHGGKLEQVGCFQPHDYLHAVWFSECLQGEFCLNEWISSFFHPRPGWPVAADARYGRGLSVDGGSDLMTVATNRAGNGHVHPIFTRRLMVGIR